MRRHFIILSVLTAAILLCGCGSQRSDIPGETVAAALATEATQAVVPEPTQITLPEETEAAKPEHSELYLPDCAPEQMAEYFTEVVLNVEYTDGTGSDDLVKKWLSPIYYRIYGPITDTDREVLEDVCRQLNGIPGFPGIYTSDDPVRENVSIHFLDPAAFTDSFSDVIHGEDAFGAAQFWYYTDTNELNMARIGCRTDIDQAERNSVLVEEIVNILGISDTVLRPDSITYQFSNDSTALSDIDLVILKLLYHPDIQCNFDVESCAEVIAKLYY